MNNILSVAQVNAYIKKLFEMDYIVKNIWIQGEISNMKVHSSGHIYFTLKDSMASIACVLFRGYRQGNDDVLRNGNRIIANGSVSVYERTGQYQLYVKDIIRDGVGHLYQQFELLKEKLDKKGWFLDDIKKKLPLYPKKVGIVTSGTGAALQDILNIAGRRNPFIQLVLYPTLVQGSEAKYNIVKAIKALDKLEEVEVIIVGRGGGSLEDLWPFNEEIVAEAIFEAKTPIISAVGHEIDFTISDFVSDLRAPTPSAAAELVIPAINDIDNMLNRYRELLSKEIGLILEKNRNRVKLYNARLDKYHPYSSVHQMMQYINDLQEEMETAIINKIKEKRNYLIIISERLKGLSPLSKLKDGYGFITDEQGLPIKNIKGLRTGDIVNIQLIDGQADAKILTTREEFTENE